MSLFFAQAHALPAQPGSADNFTGDVQVRPIAANQDGPASGGRVPFGHGGRTHRHTHSGEQVLYFLAGQEQGRAVGTAGGRHARRCNPHPGWS